MIRFLSILVTSSCLAQTPGQWAIVTYLQAKPGMADAQLKLQREIGDKGAAANIAKSPSIGYVRMVRVHPSEVEVGHNVVYFYVRNTPPDFLPADNSPFLAAIGLTREQWVEKSASVGQTVKSEIWRSMFAHGPALAKGDLVRLRHLDPAPKKLDAARAYRRDWQGPIRQQLVKQGAVKVSQFWELGLVPESAPANFIEIDAYATGDQLLKGWPNRIDLFRAAHPGKDYLAYERLGDETDGPMQWVVYRVEEAIWK